MSPVATEVAIVGGGLIGCAAAYYLRKRGRPVAVLERGLVGGESSGVSFGNLRLQGRHIPELPLALRAQAMWERLEAELGASVEFAQAGHAHVALTPEHVGIIERHAKDARPHGLAAELLDRRETIRRWPFLGAGVLAASWSPRDAIVNPRLVAPAFARAAIALGAVINEGTEVAGVEHGNGRFTLRTQIGGEPGPTFVAERLVNAAGFWGGRLARQFGDDAPVFAAGPAEIVTEPIAPFVAPVIHAVDGSILFRQTPSGNVLFAGHPRIKVDPESRRTRVPPATIAANMARLAALAPGLRSLLVIRSWTGIEGYLPDMLPAFGASERVPGLFHAFAFSGHGLQIGPAIGAVLAELIVDGATPTPIEPLAITRFRTPRPHDPAALRQEFADDVLAQRPDAPLSS